MEVAATNDGWSTLEKLILVQVRLGCLRRGHPERRCVTAPGRSTRRPVAWQAVNRHGENWVTISRVLRTHPAVALRATHDDKFFSQKARPAASAARRAARRPLTQALP